MPYGCISASRLVCEWSRSCSPPAASSSATRPCGMVASPAVRQSDPSSASPGRRQMASRRGRAQNCREEALVVASGGPERHRARYPGATPPRQRAAKRLLRKLLKKQMRPPRVLITDKLASYGAAKREVMPTIEHRQHKGLNNRAENSHQPTRRRERQMKQFKSAGQAQRFLSAHDQINNLFHLRRDHVPAAVHRVSRTQIFQVWAEICSIG